MYILTALVGLGLLIWSAERLLHATLGIAAQLRLPPAVIGATALALGTSLPEVSVALSAVYHQHSDIAIGNAIGSNIANLGLALGLTALLLPLTVPASALRRILPASLAAIVLSCVALVDLQLSRIEGFALLAGYALTTWLMLASGASSAEDETHRKWQDWLWFAIGLAVLGGGAELLVYSSVQLALELGISELVVGVSAVAIGTSLPELSASLSAARHGQHGIAFGNIFGSNVFNLFGVLGLTAVLSPWQTADNAILYRDAAFCLVLSVAITALLWGQRWFGVESLRLGRMPAVLLLGCYTGYLLLLFR